MVDLKQLLDLKIAPPRHNSRQNVNFSNFETKKKKNASLKLLYCLEASGLAMHRVALGFVSLYPLFKVKPSCLDSFFSMTFRLYILLNHCWYQLIPIQLHFVGNPLYPSGQYMLNK